MIIIFDPCFFFDKSDPGYRNKTRISLHTMQTNHMAAMYRTFLTKRYHHLFVNPECVLSAGIL